MDKWLFLKAGLLATAIQLSFKITSYKNVVKLLNRFSKKASPGLIDDKVIRKYHHLIVLVDYLRPYTGINCLGITTTFWFLMKQKGILTDVKFGVKKEHNQFKSHAWLEYNGMPLTLNSEVKNHYSVFQKSIL